MRLLTNKIWLNAVLAVALSLTACDKQNSTSNGDTPSTTPKTSQPIPAKDLTKQGSSNPDSIAHHPLSIQQSNQKQQQDSQSEVFAEMLTTSMARVASDKSDVCPKLLDFKFASQSIARQNEKMVNNYCEYLVFLDVGDRLNVAVNNDIKAEIIAPVWFNFQNGGLFVAEKFDRYTLKLSYNGTRYNPNHLQYDVTVTKNPTVVDK